ncbi:MAG: sporulation protein YabP [Ruminococcaceae bacterium]|nr:sporulation protein YabP [Oscillospiraceae bacterium]
MNREDSEKISYGNAVIENRKTLTVTGVNNIISFDENSALLDSQSAVISVDGGGLQIMKMDVDSGEVVIVGRIDALAYSDKKQGVKRLGGFFRGGK